MHPVYLDLQSSTWNIMSIEYFYLEPREAL